MAAFLPGCMLCVSLLQILCASEAQSIMMCRVFTCARKAEDLEELLSSCKAAGWDVQGMVADVSTAEGRAALLAQVSDAFGGQLNVLFNNVGTNVRKPTVEFTEVRGTRGEGHQGWALSTPASGDNNSTAVAVLCCPWMRCCLMLPVRLPHPCPTLLAVFRACTRHPPCACRLTGTSWCPPTWSLPSCSARQPSRCSRPAGTAWCSSTAGAGAPGSPRWGSQRCRAVQGALSKAEGRRGPAHWMLHRPPSLADRSGWTHSPDRPSQHLSISAG